MESEAEMLRQPLVVLGVRAENALDVILAVPGQKLVEQGLGLLEIEIARNEESQYVVRVKSDYLRAFRGVGVNH